MPLLSVHMPVRDAERTVGVAIRSTLRAMPRDAELVVWDDGSKDGTADVVVSVPDRRVRLLSHPVSVGPGQASRELMQRTDSDYVARMDADDIAFPTRFAVQLKVLQTDAADVCFTPILSFRTRPFRIRPGLPLPLSAAAMPLHLLVHNLLCQPTMTATRAAIEDVGSYRACLAEDHELYLRLLTAGKRLVRLISPQHAYRHHSGQVSGNEAFALRALNEPAFQESYGALARAILNREPTWLPYLWPSEPMPWEEREAALRELEALVNERGRTLRPLQRSLLARTTRHLRG